MRRPRCCPARECRHVLGLLSDSRRKSMSAMLERVRDPGTYQAFQHFITDAPWSAERVWRHLRDHDSGCTGVLILDGTSFPKQGPHSVGVARQYCGALGKIANCQTAVTAALWTGAQAWMLGAAVYLPESWLTPEQRTRARIPASVRGQPKWQLALTLLRQVRAGGITVTAVLGDAEFGESATLRRALHRAQLPYALGVSSTLTVFVGTPALVAPAPRAGTGARHRGPHWPPTCPPSRRASGPRRSLHARGAWCRGATAASRLASSVRCDPRHPRARLARPSARARGVAPLRTRRRRERSDQVLSGPPARHSVAAHPGATHPSAVGDRAAVSGAEGRTRPRSLRRAHPAGMAAPRRPHRARVHLAAVRTPPTAARTCRRCRVVRAVITEILTAHFFVTRPHYLKTMQNWPNASDSANAN